MIDIPAFLAQASDLVEIYSALPEYAKAQMVENPHAMAALCATGMGLGLHTLRLQRKLRKGDLIFDRMNRTWGVISETLVNRPPVYLLAEPEEGRIARGRIVTCRTKRFGLYFLPLDKPPCVVAEPNLAYKDSLATGELDRILYERRTYVAGREFAQ